MACPFGFSVADLAKAIKLARDIYVNCFTEGQGASKLILLLEDHDSTLGYLRPVV